MQVKKSNGKRVSNKYFIKESTTWDKVGSLYTEQVPELEKRHCNLHCVCSVTQMTQPDNITWICLLLHISSLASMRKHSNHGINCTSSCRWWIHSQRKENKKTLPTSSKKRSMKESQHWAFFLLLFHTNNYIPWMPVPKIFSKSRDTPLPNKDLKFPCTDPSQSIM